MATIARFPEVFACIQMRSGDMAGLPLIASRKVGSTESILDSHPTIDLLNMPAPGCPGLVYRRQVYADWTLTGNSMSEQPSPDVLYRLHPQLAIPEVNQATTRIEFWTYNSMRRIDASQVIHVPDISWSTSLNMVLGESRIRALNDDLTTVLRAKEMAAKQSTRGRPDVFLSPRGDTAQALSAKSITEIEKNWERFAREGLGMFVVGGEFDLKQFTWSPRDTEYIQQRELTRDVILSVMQVPPARYGLATANYGTQRQQMKTYWEGLLNGMGATFEAYWSMMAQQRTGQNDHISHDRSRIEALQLNRTEALLRVERWVNLGSDPNEAASYEGFEDAPNLDGMEGRMRPPAQQTEVPQERQLVDKLHEHLQRMADRYERRSLASDGDPTQVRALDAESMRTLEVLEGAGIPAELALAASNDIASFADEAAAGFVVDGWERGVQCLGLRNLSAFGRVRALELVDQLNKAAA